MNKTREFRQFVRRNRSHPPKGIVIAELCQPVDGEAKLLVGWSFVNKSAGDKFNKEEAIKIAKNRMVNKIPHEVQKVINNVIKSAVIYNKNIKVTPVILSEDKQSSNS